MMINFLEPPPPCPECGEPNKIGVFINNEFVFFSKKPCRCTILKKKKKLKHSGITFVFIIAVTVLGIIITKGSVRENLWLLFYIEFFSLGFWAGRVHRYLKLIKKHE